AAPVHIAVTRVESVAGKSEIPTAQASPAMRFIADCRCGRLPRAARLVKRAQSHSRFDEAHYGVTNPKLSRTHVPAPAFTLSANDSEASGCATDNNVTTSAGTS